MSVTEKWLNDCEDFADAQDLDGGAVIYLQARLKRLVKEFRLLQVELEERR